MFVDVSEKPIVFYVIWMYFSVIFLLSFPRFCDGNVDSFFLVSNIGTFNMIKKIKLISFYGSHFLPF